MTIHKHLLINKLTLMDIEMQDAPDTTMLMRTLADPTRRAVFERIVKSGEASVVELTRASSVSQPAVSQHLRALKSAGLVVERRQGRNAYYRAEPRGLTPLIDWLDVYAVFWRERFANLKLLLKEIDTDE